MSSFVSKSTFLATLLLGGFAAHCTSQPHEDLAPVPLNEPVTFTLQKVNTPLPRLSERGGASLTPISQRTIEQHPHLAGYVGNILMANDELHIVASALAAGQTFDNQQRLIVAAFRKTADSKDTFVYDSSFGILALTPRSANQSIQATQFEFKQDPKGNIVAVEYALTVSDRRSSLLKFKAILSLQANQSESIVSLFPDGNGKGSASLSELVGVTLFGPARETFLPEGAKPEDLSPEKWVYMTQVADRDSSSLTASVPFQMEKHPGGTGAILAFSPLRQIHLFLGFGAQSVVTHAMLSKQIWSCAQTQDSIATGDSLSASGKSLLQGHQLRFCGGDRMKTRARMIRIETHDDPMEALFPFRILGLSLPKTGLMTAFSMRLDEEITVPVPKRAGIRMIDLPSSSSWPESDISDGHPRLPTWSVEEREWGEVTFAPVLPRGKELHEPALVTVYHQKFAKGHSFGYARHDGLFGVDTFAVTKWPFQVELPDGNYSYEIYSGKHNWYCQGQVTVGPQSVELANCEMSIAHFENSEKTESSPIVVLDETLQKRSSLTASLNVSNRNSHLLQAEPSKVKDSALIHQTSIADGPSALRMKAYSLNEDLGAKWDRFRKDQQPKNELYEFVSFVRAFYPAAILELSCPGEGIALGEYFRFVSELRPDALSLYGCEALESDLETRARFLGAVVQTLGHTPIITRTSEAKLSFRGSSFPIWEGASILPAGDLRKRTIANIRIGQLVSGMGAQLRFDSSTPANNSPIRIVTGTRGRRYLSLPITVGTKFPSKNLILYAYSEQGLLASKPVDLSGKQDPWLVELKSEQPRWIRIEVRGELPVAGTASLGPKLLAETGFVRIAKLQEQR